MVMDHVVEPTVDAGADEVVAGAAVIPTLKRRSTSRSVVWVRGSEHN